MKSAANFFAACGADSACPAAIQNDCEKLLEETLAATPTVIFSIVDEKGEDITQARIFTQEELVTDRLDGQALKIDPGAHHLRFVLPRGEEIIKEVLIREREKNRLIQVQLEAKSSEGGAAPLHESAPEVDADRAAPKASMRPVLALSAAGVAVTGLAVFGAFALHGDKKKAELEECAPACPRSLEPVRRDVERSFLIADVGLGVAVVSGIVAGYLFATTRTDERRTAVKNRPWFFKEATLTADTHGPGFTLSGGFD